MTVVRQAGAGGGTDTGARPHHGRTRRSKTMARFFVNRPIVAIVISIITVLLGVVAMQRPADCAVSRRSCRR